MTDNIYVTQQNNEITVTESNNEVIVATSGYQGAKGSQILTGNGAPSSSLGLQGDFYIDKSSYYVYGPKISNTQWDYTPAISLAGTNGKSFLTGSGAPAQSLGSNGDSYLNTSTGDLYLKSSPIDFSQGTWSITTNIINPARISFVFEQQSASKGGRTPADGGTGNGGWYVYHNLGYKPAVTISDYGNNNVECDIEHVNVNLLILTFSTSISGYAYCS